MTLKTYSRYMTVKRLEIMILHNNIKNLVLFRTLVYFIKTQIRSDPETS